MKKLTVTKKAKKVTVIYQEFTKTTFITGYNCPSCTLNIFGAGIKKDVIRFRCGCGQELIIDKFVKKSIT